MDDHAKASALGFGLVMFTQVASLVAKQIQTGRTGFGHLEKTIELPLDKVNQDFFLKGFRQRLAAVGFQSAGNESDFIQGGAKIGELGAAPHAKTKKLLTLRVRDSGPDHFVASFTLRYLNLVVLDTGESAYRDAVLDFVSGTEDSMISVPNDSLMAINSLLGGAMACVAVILLVTLNQLNFWPAIPILGVTEFAVGLLALYSISQKPAEITGRWKAIAGIVLSLAAVSLSVYFIVATRSAPPA